MAEMWLEDFRAGQVFESPYTEVGREEIVGFARRYDPQPFHLDPAAARDSVFGGLVASGWHTAALTMRLFVDHGPRPRGGLVGLGVDELRWQALREGSRIRIRAEVLEVRRSKSRTDRGTVRIRLQTLDEEGREVQHALPTILVPARTDGSG
jgi:acyl dehydratase